MEKNLEFIGLAGTNGSGKDTVGHILADKYGYLFVDVTEFLRNEARRRAVTADRQELRTISAEWRRELGLGILVEKAIAQYEKESEKYTGVVMASLRNPGEADRIHEFGGTMVWLDADPKVRYDRIQSNASVRNRAAEDNKTFEQFIADENIEMHSQEGDSATLDMTIVKSKSDITIFNNSNDLNALQSIVEKALGL